MGRYGQSILTIAGTAVGAYFGYPALGAALGSLAGGLLFSQKTTVSGSRLSDVSQTVSSVGTSIPRGWGTFPASGCVIVQTDLREVIETEEVGGKGGSSQTQETYTYYQDFAIGLSDGEDPIAGLSAIGGVRTIWANGKAIYDRRPRGDDESDDDFRARMAASDALDEQMVVYLGTEDQMPDPTLEAFFGVGEISAFRGLAYVVFINWQNKSEDGNRMPSQWKFELYDSSSSTTVGDVDYAQEKLYPWESSAVDPRNSLNNHAYLITSSGGNSTGEPVPDIGPYDDLPIGALETYKGRSLDICGFTNELGGGGSDVIPSFCDDGARARDDNSFVYLRLSTGGVAGLGELIDYQPSCLGALPSGRWTQNCLGGGGLTASDTVTPFPSPDGSTCTFAAGEYDSVTGGACFPICLGGWDHCRIRTERIPVAPPNPCAASLTISGYCVDVNGRIVISGDWEYDDSQDYRVLQRYNSGFNGMKYPLGPARPEGHPQDTQSFWESAYLKAVLRGEMEEGLEYGVDYPQSQSYGYRRTIDQTTVETEGVSVANMVRDICREAGMVDDDVDVTDLAELTVMGYVRTRVMSARDAIEPLRQACFFDGIESERREKFVRRGKPVVATIDEDDLGAYIGEPPETSITTREIQETDLPRSVRVHYLSQSRDYESGEQASLARVQTRAVNDQDIELSIVLTDEHAARIAESLWANAWAERSTHETTVDAKYHALEPADAIAVPLDGFVERMRITEITDVLPSLRHLNMNRDDDGSYVSYAIATIPPFVPPTVELASPVEAVLLDLPPLRDEDDDAGFYVAMRPFITNSYSGAALYRSVDGGGNYVRVAQTANQATIGLLVTSLAVGPSSIWDEGNELYIEVQTGSLESRSEAAVLEGANAAAIGAHGRWEIVQFRTVAHVVDNIYRLTGLLRGRRGTEHNIGTSQQDDRFVLISGSGIARVPLPLASVGHEYLYKSVGTGTSLDIADAQSFTGRGEALKPFSPTAVHAVRSASTRAWTLDWIRRGRFGETLQSGTDIPLSEEREDYEVDILNAEGEVVRTISVSTPEATYSRSYQIADFGEEQESLDAIVYQISTSVGRGAGTEVSA